MNIALRKDVWIVRWEMRFYLLNPPKGGLFGFLFSLKLFLFLTCNYFFVTSFRISIWLPLRRTLVRSVILFGFLWINFSIHIRSLRDHFINFIEILFSYFKTDSFPFF